MLVPWRVYIIHMEPICPLFCLQKKVFFQSKQGTFGFQIQGYCICPGRPITMYLVHFVGGGGVVQTTILSNTWNAKCPIFLGNFTPKTSNYCLKKRALGFPGMRWSSSPGFHPPPPTPTDASATRNVPSSATSRHQWHERLSRRKSKNWHPMKKQFSAHSWHQSANG